MEPRRTKVVVTVWLLVCASVNRAEVNADKRLVLHSDVDIIQKLNSLEQEVQRLRTDLAALQQSTGSTFVRWGRTVCGGNSTQVVYTGYVGGPHYNEKGGGSNTVCLPEHPTWAQYQSGTSDTGGHMYGTEYGGDFISTFNPFGFRNNEDAPCAVCRTDFPTTIVIPGSTQCYSGWTMQYTGYLMSSYYTHHATDYVCVDANAEAVLHGEKLDYGNLFYFVQAKCGALPCQTYPDGRQLACTVCSK